MQVASIELYDLLKVKIGETEAKTLVGFIEQEAEHKFEQKKEGLASKQDIAEQRLEMEKNFKDMYKWMFAQTFVIITIIVALLKFL